MPTSAKACPIVVRLRNDQREVLAFAPPLAGKQFVKGTIQVGESPLEAAIREMREESGLWAPSPLRFLGVYAVGENGQSWHFFKCFSTDLPDTWLHQTEDDFGHTFAFFWPPLKEPLDQDGPSIFHEAFDFFAPYCAAD